MKNIENISLNKTYPNPTEMITTRNSKKAIQEM